MRGRLDAAIASPSCYRAGAGAEPEADAEPVSGRMEVEDIMEGVMGAIHTAKGAPVLARSGALSTAPVGVMGLPRGSVRSGMGLLSRAPPNPGMKRVMGWGLS